MATPTIALTDPVEKGADDYLLRKLVQFMARLSDDWRSTSRRSAAPAMTRSAPTATISATATA